MTGLAGLEPALPLGDNPTKPHWVALEYFFKKCEKKRRDYQFNVNC